MEWLKEQSRQAQKVDTQNIHELASVVRKRLHLPCVIQSQKFQIPFEMCFKPVELIKAIYCWHDQPWENVLAPGEWSVVNEMNYVSKNSLQLF